MRSIITVVSVALFTVAVTGSAFAAPSTAVHQQAIEKMEKKGIKNCKFCKKN